MEKFRKNLLALGVLARPWTNNAVFFVTMYVVGVIVAFNTEHNPQKIDVHYAELFFDLSLLSILFTLVGKKAGKWLRRVAYVLGYGAALVDLFVFTKYDTTISPTILMLLGETDKREAGEFLSTALTADVLLSPCGAVLLLIVLHALCALFGKRLWQRVGQMAEGLMQSRAAGIVRSCSTRAVCGVVLAAMFIAAGCHCWDNKAAIWRLLSSKNIGEVEHKLTKNEAFLYQPLYRIAFSIRANELTAQQLDVLREKAGSIRVDSCSYASPTIVLIIGESYSRHHSQQYGYWQETTPRQCKLERSGQLTKFTDVVSPWNLTSFVFKHMFSTYCVGDKGDWCDYPLFPELFRAAGYHVTFLTNEFVTKKTEEVYDFSGGFFLNDSVLSKAQFDTRNTRLYRFDQQLVDQYHYPEGVRAELAIFHLMGQHVNYGQRYPLSQYHFFEQDYKTRKPHLNERERRILTHYDNATRYNDSVVCNIVDKFKDREAIVIYVPDHGEECYEGNEHIICRLHSAKIDARLAQAEFDIPFWIYCSPTYAARHPQTVSEIRAAAHRRYMTDALPHLLLYLAGIHTPSYREEMNLLSPNYNERRPRLLKHTADYDKLLEAERAKKK